jgi:hypothetical protein
MMCAISRAQPGLFLNRLAGFFFILLVLPACVSTPEIKVAPTKGAKMGVFWFSGLNGDQAAATVTRELINAGFNTVDTGNFNQVVHRLGINPTRINSQDLNRLKTETGVEYMLVGSSVVIPGVFNFSHAGMSVYLIDVKASEVIWKEKYGNPIWTGVLSTSDDIEKGAMFLVRKLGESLGDRIQSRSGG